ncbi:hypothetical protein Q7P37_005846 [Cladosporium fusiforme]
MNDKSRSLPPPHQTLRPEGLRGLERKDTRCQNVEMKEDPWIAQPAQGWWVGEISPPTTAGLQRQERYADASATDGGGQGEKRKWQQASSNAASISVPKRARGREAHTHTNTDAQRRRGPQRGKASCKASKQKTKGSSRHPLKLKLLLRRRRYEGLALLGDGRLSIARVTLTGYWGIPSGSGAAFVTLAQERQPSARQAPRSFCDARHGPHGRPCRVLHAVEAPVSLLRAATASDDGATSARLPACLQSVHRRRLRLQHPPAAPPPPPSTSPPTAGHRDTARITTAATTALLLSANYPPSTTNHHHPFPHALPTRPHSLEPSPPHRPHLAAFASPLHSHDFRLFTALYSSAFLSFEACTTATTSTSILRASSRAFAAPLPRTTRLIVWTPSRCLAPAVSRNSTYKATHYSAIGWLRLVKDRAHYNRLLCLPRPDHARFFDWLEERRQHRNWTISYPLGRSIFCTPAVL